MSQQPNSVKDSETEITVKALNGVVYFCLDDGCDTASCDLSLDKALELIIALATSAILVAGQRRQS